jgi:hypothetical protein
MEIAPNHEKMHLKTRKTIKDLGKEWIWFSKLHLGTPSKFLS